MAAAKKTKRRDENEKSKTNVKSFCRDEAVKKNDRGSEQNIFHKKEKYAKLNSCFQSSLLQA
jgi:hypothetical protein